MRLIDADKLMENKFKNDISYNAFCNLVKRQPSIDAVKHGVWEIYVISMFDGEGCRCSECGFKRVLQFLPKLWIRHERKERRMNDLISRQDAIEEFYGVKFDEGYCTEYEIGYNDGIDFAVDRLSVLPSAQPERKKGRWIYNGSGEWFCSECRTRSPFFFWLSEIHQKSNYCYNCGADMRGEEDVKVC